MEREASASSIDMAISVSFKGAPLELPNAPFPTSTTVGQLQMLLRDLTGIEVAHQKLIHRGRTLVDPTAALGSLLPSSPLTSQQTLKLALIGATAREIRQLEVAAQAAAKRRGRVVDDLVLLSFDAAAARRPARGGLRRRQYGFGAIEVLPGLPEQERARAILEELAQDPGVLHVMATFKWNVGALCELYPEVSSHFAEGLWTRLGLTSALCGGTHSFPPVTHVHRTRQGYVGVSDVCVMGLNQNKGQKILLRLRTDDLKVLEIKGLDAWTEGAGRRMSFGSRRNRAHIIKPFSLLVGLAQDPLHQEGALPRAGPQRAQRARRRLLPAHAARREGGGNLQQQRPEPRRRGHWRPARVRTRC